MEYVTNAPTGAELSTIPPWDKPKRDPLPRVLSFATLAVAVAALAVSLMHPGPQGLRGLTGAPGPAGTQGETGPQGPAATTPYDYICTITNVPGFPGGGLQTGYYPCSPKNPNG